MTCRLDRLWPLTWLEDGLVSGKFHSSDNETEATCQTRQLFGPKADHMAPSGTRNDVKIEEKAAPGTTFSENGKYAIRSRLCSPNTIFATPFRCVCWQNAGQGTFYKRHLTYARKITPFVHVGVVFRAPGCSQRHPQGVNLASFSVPFAWLRQMISQGCFRRPIFSPKRPCRRPKASELSKFIHKSRATLVGSTSLDRST